MILLARPAPHLPRSLAALHAAGFTQVHSVALSQPAPLPVEIPPQATALILSSPLAIPALAAAAATHLPVYAVGPTTATAAMTAGFRVVFTGNANGASLATAVAAMGLAPQVFVHLHGDNITPPLPWYPHMHTAGHTLLPFKAYSLNPLAELPPETSTQLRQKAPTRTLLFSPESATHLAILLKQATIPLAGTAIAISEAVAATATPHWPHVVTAPISTLDAMVATLRHNPPS